MISYKLFVVINLIKKIQKISVKKQGELQPESRIYFAGMLYSTIT